MLLNLAREIATLQRMGVAQLRDRYAEVFGETTNSGNKVWLLKRIAWRLQANAEGGLSDRARRRAEELACEADLRMTEPRESAPLARPVSRTLVAPASHDPRLPPPGSILTRPYKAGTIQVTVLANGFEYDGEVYPSLSAVAKVITGSHCNGFLFFRLTKGASR